jgi:hypothetical protein
MVLKETLMSYELARRTVTHLVVGAVLAVALVGLLPSLASTVALILGVVATIVVGIRRSLGAAALMIAMWLAGAALAAAAFVGLVFMAFAGGAQIG